MQLHLSCSCRFSEANRNTFRLCLGQDVQNAMNTLAEVTEQIAGFRQHTGTVFVLRTVCPGAVNHISMSQALAHVGSNPLLKRMQCLFANFNVRPQGVNHKRSVPMCLKPNVP